MSERDWGLLRKQVGAGDLAISQGPLGRLYRRQIELEKALQETSRKFTLAEEEKRLLEGVLREREARIARIWALRGDSRSAATVLASAINEALQALLEAGRVEPPE
jgi:hypothetical protein